MSDLRSRAKALLEAARREREARHPVHRKPTGLAASRRAPIKSPGTRTIVLGRDSNAVAFELDEQSRLRHTQVIGTTGSGKSNLFTHMAQQDIENGHGLLFIDPHGSHNDSCYRRLVTWLVESGLSKTRTIHLVDPNAGSHCTGFNPLAVPEGHHPAVIAEAGLECFQRMWGDEDPDSKPTIQRLLPAVFGALAERGLTLAEAMAVLDPDDRDGLRDHLANEVQDAYARQELSWLEDMGAERGGRHDLRIELTGPRNRVAKLIRAPAIRTMVGQTERVIDLRRAMDEGHIILCNLSGGGLVYEKAADLLGRLLVRFLLFHAKRRRRPEMLFPVYFDECQRYLSGDLPVALAELRKQGVALTLGSQWQSQLADADEEILSAVRNATNCKIAFQIKDHKEAADLAEMLIPLDLEQPIAVLSKETVVGYQREALRNGGATTSTGTSASTAHSVIDNRSVTRSEATTRSSADTVSDSTTRSRSTTEAESESETVTTGTSETVGESGSQTTSYGGSESTGESVATGISDSYGYDSPPAVGPLGWPDSYTNSSGTTRTRSGGSAASWASAEQSAESTASTVNESTAISRGRSRAETVGEAETHGTAHTEGIARTEGVARSTGKAIGSTTTAGTNAGTAHSRGFSEALIPIMAMRPGGVHSKENVLYKAAQMLRSLPSGRCVINYVGSNGLETAILQIPYRRVMPLSEDAFARLRNAVFDASPSAQPIAEAVEHVAKRIKALGMAVAQLRKPPPEPEEPKSYRVPAPKNRTGR